MKKDNKVRCCFCDYSSTARGVAAHMGKEHKRELEMRKRIVGLGRLPRAACECCGMIHERFPRDGWMADRRWLEHNGKSVKSAFVVGRFPPGYKGNGEQLHLANLTPPKGADRIVRVMFFSPIPGEFIITASGKVHSFDVEQHVIRGYRVRKVA